MQPAAKASGNKTMRISFLLFMSRQTSVVMDSSAATSHRLAISEQNYGPLTLGMKPPFLKPCFSQNSSDGSHPHSAPGLKSPQERQNDDNDQEQTHDAAGRIAPRIAVTPSG